MVLADGLQTVIGFSLLPFVLPEKEVTPPGFDGGGPIDVTTNRNTKFRTMYPKWLRTLSNMTATVTFDPDWIPSIEAVVNINQIVDVVFPDGFVLRFWGYLDKFVLGSHKEGEQPTATITIVPTNIDSAGDEIGPDFFAGTTSAAYPAGGRGAGA